MPNAIEQDVQNFQTSGAGQAVQADLHLIGPYIDTFTRPLDAPQQYNKPITNSSGSGLQQFGHFLGGLATGMGHLATGATDWLTTNVKNFTFSLPRVFYYGYNSLNDNNKINNIAKQNDALYRQGLAAKQAWQEGKLSLNAYRDTMNGIMKQMNATTTDMTNLTNKINVDTGKTRQAALDLAAATITVMSDGIAGAVGKGAEGLATVAKSPFVKWISSEQSLTVLNSSIKRLEQIASDPVEFNKLSPAAQKIFQQGTAEVLGKTLVNRTPQQIAKTTVANFLLKYPIQFNYLQSQADIIYKELDQKQYGKLERTLAFNGLLALSGGPIGAALKYGGKAIKGVVGKTFARTTFLDELSGLIGNQDRGGLYRAITKDVNVNDLRFFEKGKLVQLSDSEARARLAQNISSMEAYARSRVKGGDPVAAAHDVADGVATYEGRSMQDFTHAESIVHMNNYAEAMRAVKFYHGPEALVGRVDARDLNMIITKLSPYVGHKQTAFDIFEALKQENLNKAWVNNPSFITQIENLIKKYDNPTDFNTAGRKIDAQKIIADFNSNIRDEMGKIGYIPIKIQKEAAPWVEGSGKIESAFAGVKNRRGQVVDNAFFTKQVRPFPILSHVGAALTRFGLSPYSSESLVYQMFNENLSQNLGKLDALEKYRVAGEDNAHATDTVIKNLKAFADDINSGKAARGGITYKGVSIRPPIRDLRQLTIKDIQQALTLTESEAKQVSKAIIQSMLNVDLHVRGLGDRVVDFMNRSFLYRGYARLQGGFKFAWNPFYQAKTITKVEFASQALAGGKVPMILENMFGRGPAIESTRQTLRDIGALEQTTARGFSVAAGSEAVNDGTAVEPGLTHKLFPIQEKSIAGMINSMANKMGMSATDFIHQNPQNVKDIVQMIAQYDKRSEFLNSPLMRTLNIAFFPMRFDYKVASIMAKGLAQQSTLTQLAVINGVMRAHDWLNSPQGMAWYSQNSTALKFINYFSPTESLNNVFQALSGLAQGDVTKFVGSFELGGLPFGFIPMILNGEGANFMPGYVDPATGQAVPQRIPIDAKAQLQVALQDFIGSIFTYPGQTLGLPSKSKIDKFITGAITGGQATKGEFKEVQPTLTPEQQNYAQTIQAQQGAVAEPKPQIQAPIKTQPIGQIPAITPKVKAKATKAKAPKVTPKSKQKALMI